MKRIAIITIYCFLYTASLALSLDYEELYSRFVVARSSEDATKMIQILEILEEGEKTLSSPKLLTLLADCYRELGIWGKEKERVKALEKAMDYACLSITRFECHYAYFVAGDAIGRLAEKRKSLYLLKKFDFYMGKAIELLPDDPRPLIAMGDKYMQSPWPIRNYQLAEIYFQKALKVDPDDIEACVKLALLYERVKDPKRIKKYLLLALSLPTRDEWVEKDSKLKELSATMLVMLASESSH